MTLEQMVDAAYYAAKQTARKNPSGHDRAVLVSAIDRDCVANGLDTRTVLAAVEVRWIRDTLTRLEDN